MGKQNETKIKKSQFAAKQQSVEKWKEKKACEAKTKQNNIENGTRNTIGH